MSDDRRRRRRAGRRQRGRRLRDAGLEGRWWCSPRSRTRPTSGRRCPRATCSATTTLATAFVHDARLVRRARRRPAARPPRVPGSTWTAARSSGRRRGAATTGCCSPPVPTPAAAAAGRRAGRAVTYLRTLEDSEPLRRPRSGRGRRVVIVGAGWIGLEVAAAARTAGREVTVVESRELPLLRVLGPRSASLRRPAPGARGRPAARREVARRRRPRHGPYPPPRRRLVRRRRPARRRHRRAPDVALGRGGRARRRQRRPRRRAPAHLPPGRLRRRRRRQRRHPALGRRIRVEHWDTAIEQGRRGRATCSAQERRTTRLPYFFTDQYDLGMDTSATSAPRATTRSCVRGDVAAASFSAFWLSDGRVVAGMHVNDWDAIDPSAPSSAGRSTAGRLPDESVDLPTLART